MSEEQPFVSVIVPVYNDPNGIRECLKALGSQTYPKDLFEVLVVDNGSTDHTRDIIKQFDVELLVEDEIQGSYAARNLGIESAKGEVLAFTDADCIPDPEWVANGIRTLMEQSADLVGGRVVFEFSNEKSPAERFDASVNMRNDKSVRDGMAKTANVFVRVSVVDDIGPFPNHFISGGDVQWTRKATNAGYRLVYGENAIVRHPSRSLNDLLKKQYRVGKGQIQVWSLEDQPTLWILLTGLFNFPLKVFNFVFTGSGKEVYDVPSDREVEKGLAVAAVGALCIFAMNFGRLVAMLSRSD